MQLKQKDIKRKTLEHFNDKIFLLNSLPLLKII